MYSVLKSRSNIRGRKNKTETRRNKQQENEFKPVGKKVKLIPRKTSDNSRYLTVLCHHTELVVNKN